MPASRTARVMIGAVALLALAYTAICGWFYASQRSLVYYPQHTRVAAEQTDLSVPRGDAVLRGWVVNPGQPCALLYFGGNAEDIGAMRDAALRWFPAHSTYLVAYRGYGASDGAPSQDALLADALAVYDTVRARHPDAAIDAIGRSLGSGVATYVAAQRPVARLALVTPFDRLVDVGQAHFPWLPVAVLATERYPSIDWLPRHRGALLVLRAGRDEVIPAPNTQRLIDAAPRPPRVVTFARADHNSISGERDYGEELSRFMQAR